MAVVVLRITYAFFFLLRIEHFIKLLFCFHQVVPLLWFRKFRLCTLRQCIRIPQSSKFQKGTAQLHGTGMRECEKYDALQRQDFYEHLPS